MTPRARAKTFCDRFGLRVPILQAPMASSSPPALAAAVANAGGLGGGGALRLEPAAILDWARAVRSASNGAFQLNLWIPDPPPSRDPEVEARAAATMAQFGPVAVSPTAPPMPDFAAQCDALLAAGPAVVSSMMGVYPSGFVAALKARGIAWFANATTVAEALAAEAAGADAVVAQGVEAGGHRGAFVAATAEAQSIGLFVLLPQIADAVRVPVIAAGGIMDGRGVAAALALGASAAQMGTAFLRCPETGTHPAWAAALANSRPEDTVLTRAWSGRLGRSLRNPVTDAFTQSPTAPYPIQGALSVGVREAAAAASDIGRMLAWAGQGAAQARAEPAADVVRRIWAETETLIA
ncbi:NAD(P)H-dependent flavin oxidoreductase [Humitalea sp. 24SJ18S-53]|uniref:NAD(P)H-dependent flavin oxidoreductase n=1 Tax=Humitalea sp. 24SJ18S-53 TaxID=3422307 RepID=UPI003D66E43E